MSYLGKKSFEPGALIDGRRANAVRAKPEALIARSPHRRRPHSEPESIPSTLVMHNVVVDGHRTTVRLEPVIWEALQGIARQEEITLHDLVSDINRRRTASSLSSGIRAYVVIYLAAGLREALSTRLSQDR